MDEVLNLIESVSEGFPSYFFYSEIYCRHCELVSTFRVGLKSLLQQGLSEPKFDGDLIYYFKKMC